MARGTIKWTELPENRDYLPAIADNVTITFDETKPNGSVSAGVGLAVTLSDNKTIALCADGEAVLGHLERVEADLNCTVKVRGVIPFKKGASATLTRGKKIVGALGAAAAKGYVREVATATAAELGVARGIIGDNSDTNLVEVYME